MLAGMPGGTSVGMAAGGNLAGTRMCRNAESHTAAHIGSHLDPSDGIKQSNGKHKIEMLDEDI